MWFLLTPLLLAASVDVSGVWCDQSSHCNIKVIQTGNSVNVSIGSSGAASGNIYPAQRAINLTFFQGNIHSAGIFPPETGTDFTNITWIDPADKKAHNSWCKNGAPSCNPPPSPSPPPRPTPPSPPAPRYPFPELHGGSFSGPTIADSPDPIIQYIWEPNFTDTKTLQVFTKLPMKVMSAAETSFENTASLLEPTANVLVKGNGDLAVDFGSEAAAWIEFESTDLMVSGAWAADVSMSISEYNKPGFYNTGPKTAGVQYIGNNTFHSKLNAALYEGVRYGFIHVTNMKRPFHIRAFRQVCQILPVNYNGAFSSPDAMLNRVWYTGAYTVKVNFMPDFFNSILIDRGDRISWTGDAHIAQKLALVVFGKSSILGCSLHHTAPAANAGHPFQRTVLALQVTLLPSRTISSAPPVHQASTAFQATRKSYPMPLMPSVSLILRSIRLYWVLSVADYYWATADDALLVEHYDEAVGKLNSALSFWDKTYRLHFWGSDDRVGACFESADLPENQRQFKMLGIQSVNEWSACVLACATCTPAMKQQATSFIARAQSLAQAFRNSTVPSPPPTPAPGPAPVPPSPHCGSVSESQQLKLTCGAQKIQAVAFANYGSLSANCPSPKIGSCHANITSIVAKACVGQSSCTVSCTQTSVAPGYTHHCNGSPVSDPCFDIAKEVTAAIVCTPPGPGAPAPPPSLGTASTPTGSWLDQLEIHSAAAVVAAKLTTPAEEAILHDRFFRSPVHWCSFSPFNSYFLLNAVGNMRTASKSDAYCTALSMVHSCWGGMIELGATTFWETYSTEWNKIFESGDPTPNGQTGYMR
jgi:hypothetical protein